MIKTYSSLALLVSVLGLSACNNDTEDEANINSGESTGVSTTPGSTPSNPGSSNTKPIITLNGSDTMGIAFGIDFSSVDPGVSASDAEDGDLTSKVTVDTSKLDTGKAGTYDVTYNLTDSGGAQADGVIRKVTVGAAAPTSKAEAAQFIQRATFGAVTSDIDSVMSQGYEPWLEQQFSARPTYQLPALETKLRAEGLANNIDNKDNYLRRLMRSDVWWDTVVNKDDQLRQRVAFALSEIFVVSELSIGSRPRGFAHYNDILVKHSFGNFRELLEEVTLNPIMGEYLSMLRNRKQSNDGTRLPDENYAREIMQLFTIGLKELNPDGSLKLDANGETIDTYGQEEVKAFARVFTGWGYSNYETIFRGDRTLSTEIEPMKAFEDLHDTEAKTLLNGVVLPAGQTAQQDLDGALDNLFNHPNTGPFIGKQLIQRLVTSNPSPQYIERVSGVFANNGEGVRGDLQAVVRAILMDPEAIAGSKNDAVSFGKLKEPLLKLASLWRAYEAEGVAGKLRYYAGFGELGQAHLSSPSVFNFFKPSYSQAGALSDLGLDSPEFQILNESTIVRMQNRLRSYIYEYNNGNDNERSSFNKITLNFEAEKALANDPAALIERINLELYAGSMSADTKAALVELVEATPLDDDGTNRVREAVFMATAAPEFSIQQ